MKELEIGEAVHLEFSGSAATVQNLAVYRAPNRGATGANSVNFSNEPTARVVITDYEIICESACTVALFADHNANGTVDAGERIAVGAFAANGGISRSLATPHYCAVGAAPKVLLTSGSGNITVIARGRLIREG